MTAEVHNLCQPRLSRSETGCALVPIRSLQFMAVIDAEEIIFVDSQSYAVRDVARIISIRAAVSN